MILIADSGATKTDWRAVNRYGSVKGATTGGISPIYMDEDEILSTIGRKLDSFSEEESISAVWFYGSGIIDTAKAEKVCNALRKLFPEAKCEAASDLMAAARGLCGDKPGIACILGTGSNSCLYDGASIVSNVRAGGYVLGDEASGAYFGRRLLSDYVKGLLPTAVREAFEKNYEGLDYAAIVQKVYREPMPSAYLASFAPFIAEFKNHPYVKSLLREGFEAFLTRNVAQYGCDGKEINFTGSIAYYFREALVKTLLAGGFKPGKIVRRPMDGLIAYHV